MICSVQTLGINGIRGSKVLAECYISNGLPGFDIVGLPDTAVKEARDRVRAAAKSSGLHFPSSRITVNLAPASLKKGGTHYDLPILLSILCASGNVRRPRSTSAFLGEVSLDGQIRPVSGVSPPAGGQAGGDPDPVCSRCQRGGGNAGPWPGGDPGADGGRIGRGIERRDPASGAALVDPGKGKGIHAGL